MPLRLFSYNGTSYRAQLLASKKKGKDNAPVLRYPVVTLVLYLAMSNGGAHRAPFMNDYRMNLYEIAYLSDEQVEMFTSDFKIVVDYLAQTCKHRDYIASPETIRHVHELLQLM